MLTILHRHRATTRATLPVLIAASLALTLGACSQGTDPEPSAGAAASPTAGAGDGSGGSTGSAGTTSGGSGANPATDDAGATTKAASKTSSGSDSGSGSQTKAASETGQGAPPDMAQGGPRTVVINVKGKKVDPKPGSVKIKKGEPVLLVVITDEDAELHIHGVDIEKETTGGTPTQVPLTFKQKGSYEVELHDPELLLTKFVVS